jgi:hypothetical protein
VEHCEDQALARIYAMPSFWRLIRDGIHAGPGWAETGG